MNQQNIPQIGLEIYFTNEYDVRVSFDEAPPQKRPEKDEKLPAIIDVSNLRCESFESIVQKAARIYGSEHFKALFEPGETYVITMRVPGDVLLKVADKTYPDKALDPTVQPIVDAIEAEAERVKAGFETKNVYEKSQIRLRLRDLDAARKALVTTMKMTDGEFDGISPFGCNCL